MPAVQLRATHHVVQHPVSRVDVRVLEEAVDGIEDEIQDEYGLADSDENERQHVQHELDRLLDRMKTSHVEPVELVRGVMHGVEAPQELGVVRRDVEPVAEEFRDEQHQHHLHDQWESVGPKSYRPLRGAQVSHQVNSRGKQKHLWQHHLNRHHEEQIVLHVFAIGLPGPIVRDDELQHGDRDGAEHNRSVRAYHHRNALRVEQSVNEKRADHGARIGKPRHDLALQGTHGFSFLKCRIICERPEA